MYEEEFCFTTKYVSLKQLFFFQAEDGIRDATVTGVKTCALPISCGWFATKDRAFFPNRKAKLIWPARAANGWCRRVPLSLRPPRSRRNSRGFRHVDPPKSFECYAQAFRFPRSHLRPQVCIPSANISK